MKIFLKDFLKSLFSFDLDDPCYIAIWAVSGCISGLFSVFPSVIAANTIGGSFAFFCTYPSAYIIIFFSLFYLFGLIETDSEKYNETIIRLQKNHL